MSAAVVGAPDPVIAAAHALRDAARGHLGGVAVRVRGDAAEIRTRLDGVVRDHSVRREVLAVDDTPAALCALVAILSQIGAPVRAVTHDRTAVAALRAHGAADVLVAYDWSEVPGYWRRYRPAVVVIDEHLGDHSGAALVARLPREARAVLLTSHHGARDSLADAGRVVQAGALLRTDGDGWMDRLRDEVLRALRDACG